MAMIRKRTLIVVIGVAVFAAFLGWRMVRPMTIFVVSENFERPIDTSNISTPPDALRADACGHHLKLRGKVRPHPF